MNRLDGPVLSPAWEAPKAAAVSDDSGRRMVTLLPENASARSRWSGPLGEGYILPCGDPTCSMQYAPRPHGHERFEGPDCGIEGCAREVGHIGDHRPDPSTPEPDPTVHYEENNA